MKNLLKVGALSLALVAVVFMMNTKAADDTGTLNLRITGTSGSCDYGKTLDLGDYAFDYNAHTVSGAFLTELGNTPWSCTDSLGVASWALSIQVSDVANITTNLPAHTIPAASVKISNPAAATVSGACTANVGASNGSFIPTTTAVTILGKDSALGEACKVETAKLDLSVDLAASQAVGQYSGTITIGVPNIF